MSAQMRKPAGVLGAIAGLVGFSVLGGVLVTAMVAPALAVTSVTATSSIGVFENLPDYIALGIQSQRNTLYALRDGNQVPFAQVFNQNREEVSWANVSPFIKDALVAGEDRRFYEHGGIDVPSIIRAAEGYISTGAATSGGGSTLSMQLVKNILIQDALNLPTKAEQDKAYKLAMETTPARKLKEMKMAIGLEKRYTKDQILLGYLNIAGFGGNTYGIESAAQQYYSVNAKDVTLAQAASLIAIVQKPNLRNLDEKSKYPANKARRDLILDNMFDLGYINQQQRDDAIATPIKPTLSSPNNGCLNALDAKNFCDFVVKNVGNLEALGNTPEERARNWKRGGYSVYTTLDLGQQDNAQAQVSTYAPADETRLALGSAATAVQVGTGRILVMAQNKGFDDSKDGGGPTTTAVNFSTDRAYGGSSGFPTGSTYKIFTLTDWLQNGHGTREVVNGNMRNHTSFPSECTGGVWKGNYFPRNDGGSNPGSVTVMTATARSINNAFVSMAEKLDLCQIRDTAKSMGVHLANGGELVTDPSSVLGVNEIAPLTMAAAIATVASGGTYCSPIAIDRIVGPDGKELPGQAKDCTQALSPDIANTVAYVLAGVTNGGTGTAANPRDGRPLIGKTGTTDGAVQTWMLGSTTKTALAVWVGNIIGQRSLYGLRFAGVGATSARHYIFKATIAALDAVYGGDAFPPPAQNLIRGITQAVPSVIGQTPERAQSLLESLGFSFTNGGPEASALPVGVVSRTDPGAGAQVSRGSNITVYTSDGTLTVTMPDDLVGKDPDDARKELVDLGFNTANITLTWVVDPTNSCKVTDSTPTGGATTSKDATITLMVGSDKADQAPPDCGTAPKK